MQAKMYDRDKEHLYTRDQAAARMTAEPGRVMQSCAGALVRYREGLFECWYKDGWLEVEPPLAPGTYTDAPDPSKPEEPKEPEFEVCKIDGAGYFQRQGRYWWMDADGQPGFAGYDWELKNCQGPKGYDAKVIYTNKEQTRWYYEMTECCRIPLTRPKAVRFLKGGEA